MYHRQQSSGNSSSRCYDDDGEDPMAMSILSSRPDALLGIGNGNGGGAFLPPPTYSTAPQYCYYSQSQHQQLPAPPPPTMTQQVDVDVDEQTTVMAPGRYSAEERRERIDKYRSKRNQRNFQKKITYACRKTLADSRPRVKGRFARNAGDYTETEAEVHHGHGHEDGDMTMVVNDDDNDNNGTSSTMMMSSMPVPEWWWPPAVQEASDDEMLAAYLGVSSISLYSSSPSASSGH